MGLPSNSATAHPYQNQTCVPRGSVSQSFVYFGILYRHCYSTIIEYCNWTHILKLRSNYVFRCVRKGCIRYIFFLWVASTILMTQQCKFTSKIHIINFGLFQLTQILPVFSINMLSQWICKKSADVMSTYFNFPQRLTTGNENVDSLHVPAIQLIG